MRHVYWRVVNHRKTKILFLTLSDFLWFIQFFTVNKTNYVKRLVYLHVKMFFNNVLIYKFTQAPLLLCKVC